MARPLISVRLPLEIQNQIKLLAEKEGTNLSAVMTQAAIAYLESKK